MLRLSEALAVEACEGGSAALREMQCAWVREQAAKEQARISMFQLHQCLVAEQGSVALNC